MTPEEEPNWLWEVWTQNGYVMGTGSIATAKKRAYFAMNKGEGAVIKTSSGEYVELPERRSDEPGAAQPLIADPWRNESVGVPTCRGFTGDGRFGRGRDAHPIYGPDAQAISPPSS